MQLTVRMNWEKNHAHTVISCLLFLQDCKDCLRLDFAEMNRLLPLNQETLTPSERGPCLQFLMWCWLCRRPYKVFRSWLSARIIHGAAHAHREHIFLNILVYYRGQVEPWERELRLITAIRCILSGKLCQNVKNTLMWANVNITQKDDRKLTTQIKSLRWTLTFAGPIRFRNANAVLISINVSQLQLLVL